MNEILAIAIYVLSLYGPGWSSEHKAYWEYRLGHKLEGYQEHRLARGGENPYGLNISLACDDDTTDATTGHGYGFIPPRRCGCTFPDGPCVCED